MTIITYSLRDDEKRSDQYFQDVAAFSDAVIAAGERNLPDLCLAFESFLRETGREVPHLRPQYYFELLMLGVLWRVYAHAALDLPKMSQHILAHLARLRERDLRLKPAIDLVRGLLETTLLSTNDRSDPAPILTITNFGKLLGWLSATGFFEQEVKRLTLWRDFMVGESSAQVTNHLANVLGFAAWFEINSLEALGRYTRQVDRFLAAADRNYRWRADQIMCRRSRVEYHLNMVGTEILNRCFRADFVLTSRKTVLVPPCMRFQPEERCQARPTGNGSLCSHCTPRCRVHQITKLGDKSGFQVLILPDELSVFSTRSPGPANAGNLGLVGVSCVLTNTSGGWETQALGLPAQGLPLDYCGCRWHWHKEGIPTDINLRQLQRILGIGKLQLKDVSG